MRVLVTGAGGQVGRELVAAAPAHVELAALDREALDLRDADAIQAVVADLSPQLVINAAAFTAVDRAEDEPETARRVNAEGAGTLARAAHGAGARLIHLSTDFVFDGSQNTPYRPGDAPAPLGVYGRTKLEGERLVREACPQGSVVVRTAWVYSRFGRNFVLSMLERLRRGQALRVVWDQVGTPTWAGGLARSLWRLAAEPEAPAYLHWADAGVASWYDLTVAVGREARRRGWLPGEPSIEPIRTEDYPLPAPRPPYSALDASEARALLGLPARSWRDALTEMMDGIEG